MTLGTRKLFLCKRHSFAESVNVHVKIDASNNIAKMKYDILLFAHTTAFWKSNV